MLRKIGKNFQRESDEISEQITFKSMGVSEFSGLKRYSSVDNSTQSRLVTSSAIGNQPDLSTTYKPGATEAKTAYREGSKWEKVEVSQLIYNC